MPRFRPSEACMGASTRRPATLAERADRHRLYERSVQSTEEEVELITQIYEERRGRKPLSLREDFCGTAHLACEWVRTSSRHRAVGVDIDPDVLAWGTEHNLARLTPGQRRRMRLLNADVTQARPGGVDLLVAFNFSYWVFKRRAQLLDYFRAARRGLAPNGVFIIDIFGGPDAMTECRERTKYRGFTYVWEQASYEPISGDYLCHIHFLFPDGSRIKRAFTYDWRLWTLPEVRDLLAEAGFRRTAVYWEQTGSDGEGNGEFAPAERGDDDPAWIAYVIAES
jgi:SAM-dependent methyltransferase